MIARTLPFEIACIIVLFCLIPPVGTAKNPLIVMEHFEHAPYPHPSRQEGWSIRGEFYPYEPHYTDNRIAVVIPSEFRPSAESTDYIVHFHGHFNELSRVLNHYQLPAQLEASKVNAILICPQGPHRSRDSGIGKIEEPEAFQRMMNEVIDYLYRRQLIKTRAIGKLALSAHSGGYKAVALVLDHGGLTEKIHEVYLFDSSYANLGSYHRWIKTYGRRFISFFTDHLQGENQQLMKMLAYDTIPYRLLTESQLSLSTVLDHSPLFVHIQTIKHDDVMHEKQYFLQLLQTSSFSFLP